MAVGLSRCSLKSCPKEEANVQIALVAQVVGPKALKATATKVLPAKVEMSIAGSEGLEAIVDMALLAKLLSMVLL